MNAQGQPAEELSTDLPAATGPADRDQLLSQVGPQRRSIYAFVRQLLDDFEAAASWDLLYTPTQSDDELFALEDRLLTVVHGVPAKIEALFAQLLANSDEGAVESIEDAEFYLRGIHDMVAADWKRLERKLEELRSGGQHNSLTPAMRSELCEVAADVKGKYTSSLMGATAAVVAEGHCDVLHAEPLIFPEKAAEHARNERLVADLEALVETINGIRTEVPFEQLLERWQDGSPADWYALAELTCLRGRICRMLALRNRRALYSGDYHQIREREHQFTARLRQLEALHRATWGENRPSPQDLRRFTLEVAAMVDVNLFESLAGNKAVKDLRTLGATLGKQTDPQAVAASAANLGLPPELHFAAPLFAKEDLKTFFEVLYSAVSRRASLRNAAAEAEHAAQESDSGSVPELSLVEDAVVMEEALQALPEAEPETPLVSPREAMDNLQRALREIRSPENPNLRSLQMLKRILARQYDVPRAMLKQVEPYVDQLEQAFLPHLEQSEVQEQIPAGMSAFLRKQCADLRLGLAGGGQQGQVSDLLQKVENVLDSSSVAVEDYMIKHLY